MARTIAKDHGEKRTLIQKTAARVFADTGFDRTSMSMLAKECGISKAAIYHYYGSKDDLLFDILETHLKALRDRVAKITPAGKSPEEYLRDVTLEILLAYRGADDHHRVQSRGIAMLGEMQQKTLTDYQRSLVAQVSDSVKAVVPSNIAEDRKALRAVTMSLFGMMNWFYMWNHEKGEQNRRDYAQLVCDMVLKGLPKM